MSTRTRSSLLLASAFALLAAGARADDDAMAPYRERFKSGMSHYKAGDFAGAIAEWEPIYREVGPEKGYRVAFDLARAYDKVTDAADAAERYDAFLAQIDARRQRGDALEPVVEAEERDARVRLALLGANQGRLRVESASAQSTARIDALEPRPVPFVAYVAPGTHAIVFAPGTHEQSRRDVTIGAGESVTILAPAPGMTPTPSPSPGSLSASRPEPGVPPTSTPTSTPTPTSSPGSLSASRPEPGVPPTSTHPFPSPLLLVSGGLTLGAIIFTSIEYARAASARSDFDAASTQPASAQSSLRDSYDRVRPLAYGGLGASIGLALVTSGLVTWYALGTKSDARVAPSVEPVRGGASVGVVGRF